MHLKLGVWELYKEDDKPPLFETSALYLFEATVSNTPNKKVWILREVGAIANFG